MGGFSILDWGRHRRIARELFALSLVLTTLAAPFTADAQQTAKIPRIGYLSPTGDPNTPGPWVEAFRQGLRDLGYVEGKNILVEYGYLEGKLDLTPGLVAELVQLKVDVLILITLHSALCTRSSSAHIT